MKRKIVQHGSSSLTVTLPIKWAEKFNLKKGDELNIEESGPILMVSTEQEIASPKKEFSAVESGIFTKNNLSHLYQLGYDEIEIRFEDPKTLDDIKERISDCIGFAIIDQKPNKVYIKSIATTIESEFDTLLRKAFQITNEMAKNLLEVLRKGDYSKLKEIRNMESLNNRFTDVCIRILNKKGYKVPKRTMQIYEIVKNIERIADEFKYICDLFFRKKIDKILIESLKEAVDYYLDFYNMFYKFDIKLKEKIYLNRRRLIEKFTVQLEKSKGTNSRFLHHLINIIMKTYDGAGGYFALVL
jgi:phosphate uptake regulator